MPYTPKTWINGETIFAPDLNHLESQYSQAVADVALSYLRQDTAATTYVSKADALNTYLAKAGGVVSGNFTTQGNTYLGLSSSNQNTLLDFYVPRYFVHGKRLIIGDYQDAAAFFSKEPNRSVTFSTAPNAGTAANLFLDDNSVCSWNAGVNPWPLVITLDASSNYIQGLDQWRVGFTFNDGLYVPLTVKIEADGGTGYSTVYDGVFSNVGGAFLAPAFSTLTNRVYKLKITFQPGGGSALVNGMALARIRLHNAGYAWDTFHVHRQGPQTLWGDFTFEGTVDADAFTINGVAIGSGGGGVSGSGTANKIARFTAGTTLGDSIMSQHASGSSINIAGGITASYGTIGDAVNGGYLDVRGGPLQVQQGAIYARDGITVDGGETSDGNLQNVNGLIFGKSTNLITDPFDIGILAKRTSGGNQNGLDFFTGGSSRLSITSGGDVGIGTATTSGYKLYVNGGIYAFTSVFNGSVQVISNILVGSDTNAPYADIGSSGLQLKNNYPVLAVRPAGVGGAADILRLDGSNHLWLGSGSIYNLNLGAGGSTRMSLLSTGDVNIGATGATRLSVLAGGDVTIGANNLTTGATAGFPYLASVAGTPTGTPTSRTGFVPVVFNTSDNKIYGYSGGAWQAIGGTTGGGGGTITGVTAGSGLTGGGTSGTVSLAVATGGITDAMLADPKLSLASGGTMTGGTLTLKRGDTNVGSNGSINLIMEYAPGGYKHFIRSRHDATVGSTTNAIDFFLNNSSTSGGSSAPGTGNSIGLSINPMGVGVGTAATGSYRLNVNGNIYTTTGIVSDGDIVLGGSGTIRRADNSGWVIVQATTTTGWQPGGAQFQLYGNSTIAPGQMFFDTGAHDSAYIAFRTAKTGVDLAERLKVTAAGSVVIGNGALATSATDGFVYLPSTTGTPTGTPTAYTGSAAAIFNTADNKLYVYNGGWQALGGAGGGGGGVTSITAGSGLSGGTITSSGTIAIAAGGVFGSMLASGAAVSNIGYTPLNKAGDTLTGNLTLDLTSTTTSAPRKVMVGNWGAGTAVRLALAGTDQAGLQVGYDQVAQLYHNDGIELYGATGTGAPIAYRQQTASDPAVTVVNSQAGRVGFVIRGAASQTVNVFETRTSNGTIKTAIDANGNLALGDTQAYGYKLYVNGSMYTAGAGSYTGDLSTAGTLTVEPSLGSGAAYLTVGSLGTTWANNYPLRMKNSGGTGREVLKMTTGNVLKVASAGWGGGTLDLVGGTSGLRVRNEADAANLFDVDATGKATFTAPPYVGSYPLVWSASYSSLPTASTSYRVALPSDGVHILTDYGTWRAWGPLYPMTPPPDTGWSDLNSGLTYLSTSGGVATLNIPANATNPNFRGVYRSTPATPYTVQACFQWRGTTDAGPRWGMFWRESSSGKVTDTDTRGEDSNIYAINWTNETTFASIVTNHSVESRIWQLVWISLSDDGTNRTISYSRDGKNWRVLYQYPRTTYITPDQIGFWASSGQATHPVSLTCLSWKVS